MTLSSQPEHNIDDCDLEIDRDDITANFTIVPNALIRDKSISPDCCHLIIYLISHVREWRINTKQLANEFRGRYAKDKLYSLMNEAIEAGYMKRDTIKNGSRFNGYRYTIASTPKFKKCLPHPGFPETEAPHAEKTDTKEDYPERRLSIRNNTSLKVPKEPDKPDLKKEVSEDARQLGEWMKEAIKTTAPDVKIKHTEDLTISCDNLIKKSGWTIKQLYEVFLKGLKSDFWRPHLLKANPAHYLSYKDRYITIREQNNKIEPQRKFAPASTREGEFALAQKMRRNAG